MTPSVWAPIWVCALTAAHYFTPNWLFVSVAAVATAFLSSLITYLAGPHEHIGALKPTGYTLEELARDVLDPDGENHDLSLCLGGVGVGIVPVTDWYIARLDGQRTVILEHIEGGL